MIVLDLRKNVCCNKEIKENIKEEVKMPTDIDVDVRESKYSFLTKDEKKREMLEDYYSCCLYKMTDEELDQEFNERIGD